MKEQWKQQMRQKMADYREPAPEVSWDEIEKALAANKQQAKTVAVWPRRIAAAAIVLVTAGAGYYLLNREQPKITEETAETRLIEGTIEQKPVISQKEETPELPILAKAKHKIQQAIEEKKAEALSVIAVVEDSVEQLAQAVEEPSEVQAPEPQEQPRKSSLPEARPTIYPSDFKRSASSDKCLMAKVYLSNAMLGNYNSSNSSSYYMGYFKTDYDPRLSDLGLGELNGGLTEEGGGIVPGDFPSSIGEIDFSTNPVSYHRDVNHHQPIRFGLLLRYAFNDRWSIESGLSYAQLSSDINYTSASYAVEIEQRLKYIGIPVNVSYQFWSNRFFSVYASVGGMAEKMVEGRQHMVTTKPSKQVADASVSIHPLQFSVNGGVGAEFKFVDWLSLYAEPGVGYWFDNGSGVPTYYQDKPFSFNLNVGLRFTIK